MKTKTARTIRTLTLGGLLALGLQAHVALAGPVNVNTADAATIAAELNGVGEKTAMAIVAYRDANGPFKTVEDLKNVKGVGDAIIEKNRSDILLSD